MIQARAFPDVEAAVNLCPVDFVASSVVRISTTPLNTQHHVTNLVPIVVLKQEYSSD